MPRHQRRGPKLARGLQKIGELHALIAAHAGDRRLAREIARREIGDDRLLETVLVIQHVMRDAERVRHAPRIHNVPPSAAGALTRHGRSVVVKLKRNANGLVARGRNQCRRQRRIHTTRHRNDDPVLAGTAAEPQTFRGKSRCGSQMSLACQRFVNWWHLTCS